MQIHLSYDMRTPPYGAPGDIIYRTFLDQMRWADDVGVTCVNFGEHHASPDGYIPSPLTMCASVAGATHRLAMRTNVLLAPLYDPLRLAEDAAVVQLLSGGRLTLILGAGYRPVEYAMFGKRLQDRWRVMAEVVDVLRKAWTGKPFDYRGGRVQVTPVPDPPPPIWLGGSSAASARRAARIADGWFPPLDPRLWQPWRDERVRLGHDDPGPWSPFTPTFTWISADPERHWRQFAPHIASQIAEYRNFTVEGFGRAAGPWRGDDSSIEALRRNPAYAILTPEQALELAESLGGDGVFFLNPLFSGIEPAESWAMLELFERKVMPYLPASST